jgi:RNA polymerase sigma-70 factor (ECF subfamily)
MSIDAERAIERVARESYGRLVAYLSARSGDVASAEDALSEAMIRALAAWPRDGVPRSPEAWLLSTARHALIDFLRRQRVALSAAESGLLQKFQEANTHKHPEPGFSEMGFLETGFLETGFLETSFLETSFPDERLKLLFICAHPAIDSAMHTPLMLQTVLGLDAARIANAFLMSPKTMGQRLVRAKTKIRSGGLRFEIPEQRHLPQRLQAVLEAIYGAFGIAWGETGADAGADGSYRDLTEEAIWLSRVLLQLLPDEAEAYGLLALMLYCEARRAARRGANGEYIPLAQQDPARWSRALIDEAEQLLMKAAGFRRPGQFQLEAAIQSVHAERIRGSATDWNAIACFYEQLLHLSPGAGARSGYAAAIARRDGPQAGLAILDEMERGSERRLFSAYQPYWAVRAYLLGAAGRHSEALDAYDMAIGLSRDAAVREFLHGERAKIFSPAV